MKDKRGSKRNGRGNKKKRIGKSTSKRYPNALFTERAIPEENVPDSFALRCTASLCRAIALQICGKWTPRDEENCSRAILDSGAEQALLGDEFRIIKIHNDQQVDVSGPFHDGIAGKVCNIVDGVSALVENGVVQAIIRVNRGIQYSGNRDTLLAPDQISWNKINVDLKSEYFGGTQRVSCEEFEIPLIWNGVETYFTVRKPTDNELRNLPWWTLTSSEIYCPREKLKLALRELRAKNFVNDPNT